MQNYIKIKKSYKDKISPFQERWEMWQQHSKKQRRSEKGTKVQENNFKHR